MSLYTFAVRDELDIDYGKPSFGAEAPQEVAETTGLTFRICDHKQIGDKWVVYGLFRSKGKNPQVWSAETTDGITFSHEQCLFELPNPVNHWLAGDVAVAGDGIYLLNCDCGKPPEAGHFFHAFADLGDGWKQLNEDAVYRGQDAFGLIWSGSQFVNYQTSYQPFKKRFEDNMGPNIRRVQHIRTSPDLLSWTPGGSFGVSGPYLPEDQFITPDQDDPEETEFYKFRAFEYNGLWYGALVKYISQPSNLPKSGNFPHGPFMGCEWWVSRDGLNWQRPMRHTSNLDLLPFQFSYFLHKPFIVGDNMLWADPRKVYSLNKFRHFYTYSLSNSALTTPVLAFMDQPLRLHVSFESVRLNKQPSLSQGYVMAEIVDDNGSAIEGFEKEKCLFEASNREVLELTWDGKMPAALSKNDVRLKLYFRDTRIYSLEY